MFYLHHTNNVHKSQIKIIVSFIFKGFTTVYKQLYLVVRSFPNYEKCSTNTATQNTVIKNTQNVAT